MDPILEFDLTCKIHSYVSKLCKKHNLTKEDLCRLFTNCSEFANLLKSIEVKKV